MKINLHEAVSKLRTVAALGSFVPVVVGSIGVGLVTRSKRAGVNFFTATWPKLVLTIGGVEINVIGAENLVASRPSVFIFNHRNNFDVFITAALVSENWTAVGKRELENDPIAGTIGRIVDAAFIDRDDPEAAVEGLRKVEYLAQKGLSVIIAPEGTRVDTATVGPFKKGAFRIAMSAQIPIVPVVIRNAESVAPRHSVTLHPGVIDVAVFPPLSVEGWTAAKLPDRIAQVRQLYIDTLTNWPTATLPKFEVSG